MSVQMTARPVRPLPEASVHDARQEPVGWALCGLPPSQRWDVPLDGLLEPRGRRLLLEERAGDRGA
jgi:hypothetical protein